MQLLVHSISVQGQNNFNYANLNSTSICAEYLDEAMILETVNNDDTWKGSSTENGWYYFDFNQDININSIELSLDENTCLKKCKLEFQLISKDTIIKIIVNELSFTQTIDLNTDFLILKKIYTYPRGPGHINEIRILSSTNPLNLAEGTPKIKLDRETRLNIKYSIAGLSESEIIEVTKTWKARKKFHKRFIDKKTSLNEKNSFKNRVFYGNDGERYCRILDSYLDRLNDLNLRKLFNKCQCDVRESFFERKMKPTKSMNERNFNFLGKEISYSADSTENVLVKYLEEGDAWAGHAIPHLCLMGKTKYIEKIDSLKNDANVFTQIQVIKGLLYFNETKKALEISIDIYEHEISSIVNDSISECGNYGWRALRTMNDYYPNITLPLLLDLYKKYRNLYPKEMKINDNWIDAYSYGNKYGKRIESFQGCDRSILNYIESYLNRLPPLSDNSTMKEFKEFLHEKAIHN